MNEIYYTYNNEAIASCVFLSILQKQNLEVERLPLVLPFLFNDKIVKVLNTVNSNETLESFVNKNNSLFVRFNKVYSFLLPTMINSIIILSQSNQIKIENNIIENNTSTEFEDLSIGDRFANIRQAIPKFLEFINSHSISELYKILNIQL